MARSSREPRARLRWQVLAFPLLMGIVGWVVLKDRPTSPSTPPPAQTAPVRAPTSTQVLLAHALPSSDRDEKFVFEVETGKLTTTSSEIGWRVPRDLTGIGRITRRSDESVWLWETGDRSLVLRNARGNAYLDPRLLGAFDSSRIALLAVDSDRRVILTVSLSGSIRELVNLKEETAPIGVREGKLWLVDTQPQEGIELPPRGPSTVWSVSVQGTTSTQIADDRKDRVIVNVLPHKNALALVSDKDDFYLIEEGRATAPREGRPLLWIGDQQLLFVRGGDLCLLERSNQNVSCPGKISTPVDVAFLLPSH